MHNETFTYRFDLDRDYFIDFSLRYDSNIYSQMLVERRYQSAQPFTTLVTLRPLIFLIILKKRDHMHTDIRWGYIINQIAMMAQEFNFCFLFRIHDLAPYAGLYCDGPICRMGIDKQYLMMILSCTTIGTVPTFLLLLVRMHQRIIENTDSKLKLSARAQVLLIFFLTIVLLSNVAGWYAFGKDATNADEFIRIPDLAWLKQRGGTLFLFGPPGRAEFFGSELALLLCSILIIAPFVMIISFHAMKIMRDQHLHRSLTTRTQQLQLKLFAVFFLQMIGVECFYVAPLFAMLVHMIVDVSWLPAWMIALGRCTLIIAFTLESVQLSLIFLLKNDVHRQIVKAAFVNLMNIRPYDSSEPSRPSNKTAQIARQQPYA